MFKLSKLICLIAIIIFANFTTHRFGLVNIQVQGQTKNDYLDLFLNVNQC